MVFDALAAAQRLRERGEPAVLATVVWRRGPSSGKVGSKALVHADGRVEGWIGGACAEPAVKREALGVLERGSSRLVHLGPPGELPDPPPDGTVCVPIACESEGALQVFLEPIVPAPHLVVVGRTVAVETLAAMASTLGWSVIVADDDATALPATTQSSMIVVATQGHNDEEALEAALRTEAAYVGLVASPTRAKRVLDYLRGRGFSEETVSRVHAPAGIDLGPTGHEEIAVSVLAELIRLRAAGEIPTGQSIPEQPAEAVDPVCGMRVALDGPHTATHGGATYHFCCPGCRAAFSADPDAYVGTDA